MTSKRGTNEGLTRILDLCDELNTLRHRIQEAEAKGGTSGRLHVQTRTKIQAIARDLSEYRFTGLLGELSGLGKLDLPHFLVLATLLKRYLRGATPYLRGRSILHQVFGTTSEALTGLELLAADGCLRANGLILTEDEPGVHDLLEMRFRLAETVVDAFRAEIAGVTEGLRSRHPRTGYANHREHLVDLRVLHSLYQARSDRVFERTRWNRSPIPAVAVEPLNRKIMAFAARIEQRLAATPKGDQFPVVLFQREQGLDQDCLMIVLHLVFQELHDGVAFADAVELLRLVSGSEEELFGNRGLLAKNSLLIRKELVVLDCMLESRELTSEAHLASWVVNGILGEIPSDSKITMDERLDFHLYLRNTDSSGRFFKEMEEGS